MLYICCFNAKLVGYASWVMVYWNQWYVLIILPLLKRSQPQLFVNSSLFLPCSCSDTLTLFFRVIYMCCHDLLSSAIAILNL
jgi:hypothetical protein